MATYLRFTLEVAKETRIAERTIRRLVARFDRLAPSVVYRLRGTWLAQNGKELDALAALSHDEQAKAVEMMLRTDDPQPTVAAAKIIIRGITLKQKTSADDQFSKFLALWKVTGKEARQQIRDYLATPASKKTAA